MARTPGLILPSAYSSEEALEEDLQRRAEAAGFTPFNPSNFVDDVMRYQKPPLDEALLIHFGVKGMKWGVVNEDEPTGNRASRREQAKSGRSQSSSSRLDDQDLRVLKAAGVSPSQSEHMKSKYGPGSLSENEPKHGLSPQQKKIIAGVAVGVGVAAAIYCLNRNGAFGNPIPNHFPEVKAPHVPRTPKEISKFDAAFKEYINTAGARERGYSKQMVESLSTEKVHLPIGTIFKRISTEQETSIRPGGFFASHKDSDVDRYKAILPVFWKQWGLGRPDGHIVNLKANTAIKAPSPRETFDLFKSMLNDEISIPHSTRKAKLRDVFMEFRSHPDDDSFARAVFPQMAQIWNNNDHPASKHFFQKVKDLGYNALVDINDAGALSSQPMRLLDGRMFSIEGHEFLPRAAIKLAQENIQALAHRLAMLFNQSSLFSGDFMADMEDAIDLGEEFLAHYGIRGMKWGVRKNNYEGASNRTNREARKDATEFARAKMFYGEGAGTRRKLIKAQVEAKGKKDPAYQKAFDHHLQRQDLGRHAEKARGERRRKDTRSGVRKTGNAINRAINGPFAGSAAIALIAAGAAYAKNTGLDTKAMNAVKQVRDNRKLRQDVQDLLRNSVNFGGRG